jgi:S-adenosylmethionine synthetase
MSRVSPPHFPELIFMAPPKHHVFTSESVTEGHPDKVADQISDAVLDAILRDDPNGRVACETLVTTGMAVVAGEITTSTYVHIPDIVRSTIEGIGYTDATFGFDARTCAVLSSIDRQSPDIAQGVDAGYHGGQGAGDQGMMFGYATSETRQLMPLPIMLAHRITERLSKVRKGMDGLRPIAWLRPDGKSQVSVEYEGDRPVAVKTVVVSTQHAEYNGSRKLGYGTIREGVIEEVIKPVLEQAGLESRRTRFLINPTGRFVIGGPHGDAGLTGRKIIVDTYGGMARHGGGAFSGKDPSKVDRSAAYAMRWVAKNIVEARLARRCEAQVAYAIGVAEPVSIMVDTFGTGVMPDRELERMVAEVFDLTPAAIIAALKLKKPIYTPTATSGHFGRRPASGKFDGKPVDYFTWERTDRVKQLLAAAR